MASAVLAGTAALPYNRRMRRLYLRDCTAGDVVEDVFVITGKQLAATASGKFYIKAMVGDSTAQVTARMWNATRDIFNALPDAGFLKIRGRIENYQNNLQFIIEQVWPAQDGTFEIGELVPHTSRDIDQMYRQVVELCQSVQNRHLCALLQAYLDDEKLMADFRKSPAAMSFHHAYIGGLLEHTLSAMTVGDAIVRFYPGLNRDLVLAGIFLHDLAKTWELSSQPGFDYTDGGRLVGHVVKGAIWVEQKARQAEQMLGEPIPASLVDVLQHIILSHHGDTSLDFGSARSPCTPEAIAVHTIEHFDAKMMMALHACRGDQDSAAGDWTEYMKAFSGRLYRLDVAPEDAQLPPDPPAADNAVPTLKMEITNPLFEQTRRG